MKRHKLVALVIAAVGVLTGALLYFLLPSPGDGVAGMDDGSKAYVDQMERVGGHAALVGEQLTEFFSSLFHGPRLGLTVAVVALGVAYVYYRLTLEPLDAPPDAGS